MNQVNATVNRQSVSGERLGWYLCSPPLQQLQLSVIQSRSKRKHFRQLQVRGHQAADGVSGVRAAQRHVNTLQRCMH